MNGVDKEHGKLLVPFDLVSDIIRPLERLEDGIDELKRKFEEHLLYVNNSVRDNMTPIESWVKSEIVRRQNVDRHRAAFKKGAIWTVSVGGPILITIFAKIGGAF